MKSQVITESGNHARERGIEGQMMREMEEVWERWEEVSELVQRYTEWLMMHLGILVKPMRRWRVLSERSRLTLVLRIVHLYSEFNQFDVI